MKTLKEEKSRLIQKKNALYEDYSLTRAKYRELQTADANAQSILKAQNRAEEISEERS